MTLLLLAASLLPVLVGCQTAPQGISQLPCPPEGYSRSDLALLKQSDFVVTGDDQRAALALALVGCLNDADPELRDGIAFSAYSTWLRGQQLPNKTVRALRTALLGELASGKPDAQGFRRPFAALVLAEVARADRVSPLFNARERNELVAASVEYMQDIEDYRGFDEIQGWRHAVAHTADLMMQLALNDAVGPQQMAQMRAALAQQVAARNGHFYVYGEPERLARPVLFMARRGAFDEADWTRWFDELGSPLPFDSWDDVWSSQRGLAKLHNSKAFAQVIYVNATASENPDIKALVPGALELLRRLP